MPIIVTDDQGNTQEICPASCYDGLFDLDNMTQEQIDAICNLFQCGPLDIDALATAFFLFCQSINTISSYNAYTNWEPSAPLAVTSMANMEIRMAEKFGDGRYFNSLSDNYYTVPEDGIYLFGCYCGYGRTLNVPSNTREARLNFVATGIGRKSLVQREDSTYNSSEGVLGGEYAQTLLAGNTIEFSFFADNDNNPGTTYPIRDDGGRGGAQTWISKLNFEGLL